MEKRTKELQVMLGEHNVDVAILTDKDSIFYFSGVHDDSGMDYGRPMILIVPKDDDCSIITPSCEGNMVRAMTWVKRIFPWNDGEKGEWRDYISQVLGTKEIVYGLENDKTHAVMLNFLQDNFPSAVKKDIFPLLSRQRMIKTPKEISIMKQAGEVAVAMCEAGRKAIGVGVPEFEVALAVNEGGTRKAAEFLSKEDSVFNSMFSPLIHELIILQTGPYMHMVHKRASTRKIKQNESIYMCFCKLAYFKGFHLGFDRQYFVGGYTDQEAQVYYQAIEGQKRALEMIRPGVKASDVHKAASNYYAEQGYGICYRTGRSVGYSGLEKPELRIDDDTILEEGMTFAVDGAVSLDCGVAGRVGDSIVVVKDGFEYLTEMDKSLQVL